MITKTQLHFQKFNQTEQPTQLDFISQLLVKFTQLGKSEVAFKLTYFEKMLNYMRVVALRALLNNLNILQFQTETTHKNSFENRLSQSLLDFLFHFGIVFKEHGKWIVHYAYQQLLEGNRLDEIMNHPEKIFQVSLNKSEMLLINDFWFVRDLMEKYRNPDHSFQHIQQNQIVWEKLVNQRKLDYEIRLAETLFNLIHLKIPHKIKSPFDDDYYTESGQNAFKNFTRFQFVDYMGQIMEQPNEMHVLDLGCGYGNYIEAIQNAFPGAYIMGIEKNTNVFISTKNKFVDVSNIEIVHTDFFQHDTTKSFDAILMNYVLFYFDLEGKKKVLQKAKDLLKDRGSIVLCQYFSGIEHVKKKIAKKQQDYSMTNKIKMFYSDKILYANTLWNDAVDAFAEAVKWNEFSAIIDELDLQIESMIHADPFYYSFFIQLKKR